MDLTIHPDDNLNNVLRNTTEKEVTQDATADTDLNVNITFGNNSVNQ